MVLLNFISYLWMTRKKSDFYPDSLKLWWELRLLIMPNYIICNYEVDLGSEAMRNCVCVTSELLNSASVSHLVAYAKDTYECRRFTFT